MSKTIKGAKSTNRGTFKDFHCLRFMILFNLTGNVNRFFLVWQRRWTFGLFSEFFLLCWLGTQSGECADAMWHPLFGFLVKKVIFSWSTQVSEYGTLHVLTKWWRGGGKKNKRNRIWEYSFIWRIELTVGASKQNQTSNNQTNVWRAASASSRKRMLFPSY